MRATLMLVPMLIALFLFPACGGGSGPSAGAVCNKMADCGSGSTAGCELQMQQLKDLMRGVSWAAMGNCILGMSCEQLMGEGISDCLMRAVEAAPAGVGDDFLEAYCAQSIACEGLPTTVEECVQLTKEQAGSSMDMLGIFNDQILDCMERCAAGLDCEVLYDFYVECANECDLPFYSSSDDCENGWEEDGVCVCDEGWAGQRCDVCAEGYVLDSWGDCVAFCEPDSCSGHGLCEDEVGYIRCTCEAGYEGDRCDTCADGYLDVDGRCRPTGGCTADGTPCDDGSSCTENDTCANGVCVGADVNCDDGLDCTLDSCMELMGGCINDPVPTGGPEGWQGDPECENGLDDDCDGAADQDDPDCLTAPCTVDADCPDDGNPCTAATCVASMCETGNLPDATPCPGSDACTDSFVCRHDQCLPGPSNLDEDGDGFLAETCPGGYDCDDVDPAINPGAEGPRGDPTCSDGLDNDCDGLFDAYDPSCWDRECDANGWCRENTSLTGNGLGGIWSIAQDDAWAVGWNGTILRWDGTGWTHAPSPTDEDLAAVCGCGPDLGWAVGSRGTILTFDGVDWQIDSTSPGTDSLEDIWCQCGDPNQLWVVGRYGVIYHHDGQSWAVEDAGTSLSLDGVWASAPDDIWISGNDGTIMHRLAPGVWETLPTPEDFGLNSIWGTAANQIWSVGTFGTILAWDGISWTEETADTTGIFNDVWGWPGGGDDYWIAGSWALLERRAGAWYEIVLPGAMPWLEAIHGSGPDDVWAVGDGGNILHKDDIRWTQSYQTVEFFEDVCAMDLPDGRTDAWAVGRWREGLLRWNGADWQRMDSGTREWLSSVWCAGEHGVWVISEDGYAARHTETLTEEYPIEDLPTASWLRDLSGRYNTDGRVDLWAVGRDAIVAHFDGQTWTLDNLQTSGWNELTGVWVAPEGQQPQVVAVGESGNIQTYDGTTWTPLDLGTTEDLNAVWGDGQGTIWVVGSQGLAFSWDGAAFVQRPEVPANGAELKDVWGTGPNDVWMLDWNGTLHWDGQTWAREGPDMGQSDDALTVTPSHVWTVGGYGSVLHKVR